MTVWPSGLRRWLQAPVRKGVGPNPTAVNVGACRPSPTLMTVTPLPFLSRCRDMSSVGDIDDGVATPFPGPCWDPQVYVYLCIHTCMCLYL